LESVFQLIDRSNSGVCTMQQLMDVFGVKASQNGDFQKIWTKIAQEVQCASSDKLTLAEF
jgi:Ca2+-binding EF-hand superfamily protein